MRDQEFIGLQEAYQQVYTQSEEVEQLDEITRSMGRRADEYNKKKAQDAHMERVRKHQHNMENDPEYRERHERLRKVHSRRDNGGEEQKESFDLFDYLLEYLVAEGYADTNKAALAIMANMSEEWKQSIVEGDALRNTIKTLEGKRDAMNANKPGSANTAAPGKQSVGAATYKAYQRLRGV